MTEVLNLDFLTMLTFLPLLGAVVVFLLPRENVRAARWVTLGFSVVVMIMTIGLFFDVQSTDLAAGDWAYETQAEWFPQLNATWHVGVDGVSATMILLTGILVPLAVLISFEITDRVHEHMALLDRKSTRLNSSHYS